MSSSRIAQHLKYYIDSQCRPGFSLSLGSSHCIGGSRVVLRVPVNPPPPWPWPWHAVTCIAKAAYQLSNRYI